MQIQVLSVQNILSKTLTLCFFTTFALHAEETQPKETPQGPKLLEKKKVSDLPPEAKAQIERAIEAQVTLNAHSVIMSAWQSLVKSVASKTNPTEAFGEYLGGKIKTKLADPAELSKFLKSMGLSKLGADPSPKLRGVDFQKADGEEFEKQNMQILIHYDYKPAEDKGEVTQYRIVLEGPATLANGTAAINEIQALQNLNPDEVVLVDIRACTVEEAPSPLEQKILNNKSIEGVDDLEIRFYELPETPAPQPKAKPKTKSSGPAFSA